VLFRSRTARGTAKVSPARGIKVHHLYYWCDAFRRPEIEKSHVELRYDPFDAGIVYAFVENCWVECLVNIITYSRGIREKR